MTSEQMSYQELHAEIERLKTQLVITSEHLRCLQEDLQNEWKPLITELCDALELPFDEWTDQSDLIQRAREAVK
jgi:hypothetical protein